MLEDCDCLLFETLRAMRSYAEGFTASALAKRGASLADRTSVFSAIALFTQGSPPPKMKSCQNSLILCLPRSQLLSIPILQLSNPVAK